MCITIYTYKFRFIFGLCENNNNLDNIKKLESSMTDRKEVYVVPVDEKKNRKSVPTTTTDKINPLNNSINNDRGINI